MRTWKPQREAGWDAGEPSRKKNEWVIVVHVKETSRDTTEWSRRKNQSVFQLYHWVVQVSAYCIHTWYQMISLIVKSSSWWQELNSFFSWINPSFLVWFLRSCHSESRKLFPKYPSLIRYVLISSNWSSVTTHFWKACKMLKIKFIYNYFIRPVFISLQNLQDQSKRLDRSLVFFCGFACSLTTNVPRPPLNS